jgi:Kdo2-lipid IVA lauroyltransferase/acyltransferase
MQNNFVRKNEEVGLAAVTLRVMSLRLKQAANAVISALAVMGLKAIARLDPDRMANVAAAVLRTVGPWLPEHRVGRDNLRAAFPKKSPAEIEAILRGVWDNLGRVAAEFAHLGSLSDYLANRPATSRIAFSTRDMEIFQQPLDEGKPAFVFAAHLANWELPALAAPLNGLDSTVVYCLPNLGAIAETIVKKRARHMGKLIASGADAPFKIAGALEADSHVGMLVDQHRCRRDLFRAAVQGQPDARTPGPPFRLSDSWRAGNSPGRAALPRRNHQGSHGAAPSRRAPAC